MYARKVHTDTCQYVSGRFVSDQEGKCTAGPYLARPCVRCTYILYVKREEIMEKLVKTKVTFVSLSSSFVSLNKMKFVKFPFPKM